MTVILATPFARYRLLPWREVPDADRPRVARDAELRAVLRGWLDDERAWRGRQVDALCDALGVFVDQERSALLAALSDRLGTLSGLVLLREPLPTVDRILEREELEVDERESEHLEWIEVVLIDEDDQPVPGVAYEIKLSDGRVRRGTTSSNGVIRYDQIPGGTCELTFTSLDERAWEPA